MGGRPAGTAAHRAAGDGLADRRPRARINVLPVVFTGCARDGLDEGTITHIGVRPSARGRGYGRLLLRRATATLERHGVWRIYCDTAAGNAGMIRPS